MLLQHKNKAFKSTRGFIAWTFDDGGSSVKIIREWAEKRK